MARARGAGVIERQWPQSVKNGFFLFFFWSRARGLTRNCVRCSWGRDDAVGDEYVLGEGFDADRTAF